jgi:predicted nucleic acid-binding protein
MSEKSFLDSNIIIYLYSNDEPVKKSISEKFLDDSENIIISTQVLNEFIHVFRHKRKIDTESIRKAVRELAELFTIAQITTLTIENALNITHKYNYSYFDSLIVASAIENHCSVLYTEDMHDTHLIEKTVRIVNPFKK